MPQAPEELRARWEDDQAAIAYLKADGWRLTRDFHWIKPSVDHRPSEKELDAITYLFLEWDFGGICVAEPLPRDQEAEK